MGFGAMTSLTGGGGLQSSSSSGADGDNYFNNGDLNYRANVGGGDNNKVLLFIGLAVIAVFYISKK